MDPFGGHSFLWTYREDTTQVEEGWRIGFASADCGPKRPDGELILTCTAHSGEEPGSGNALTDTYVTVSLDGTVWTVDDVDGEIRSDEEERVVGYEQPHREEPSHWEFPAVGVLEVSDDTLIHMIALWVGPYPTSAPTTVCEMKTFNSQGEKVGSWEPFPVDPPQREFERRGGWLRGTSGEKGMDIESVSVDCRQSGRYPEKEEPTPHVRPTPEGDVYPLGSGEFTGEEWGASAGEQWTVDSFLFDGDPCVQWEIAPEDPEDHSTSCIPRTVDEVWSGHFYEPHGQGAVVGGTVALNVWKIEVQGAETAESYVVTLPSVMEASFNGFIVFLPDDQDHTLIAYDKAMRELGRREVDSPADDH